MEGQGGGEAQGVADPKKYLKEQDSPGSVAQWPGSETEGSSSNPGNIDQLHFLQNKAPTRVARFFLVPSCIKWPQNIPNCHEIHILTDHKIYTMDRHSKALKMYVTKLIFLVYKYTIWQPCRSIGQGISENFEKVRTNSMRKSDKVRSDKFRVTDKPLRKRTFWQIHLKPSTYAYII
jgi:hypothetical protein